VQEEKLKYKISIDKNALKFLDKLDEFKYEHLIDEIFYLENEPRPVGCTKLNVNQGYRIKWSSYRILYIINDKEKLITIYKIAHRKEAYKKK